MADAPMLGTIPATSTTVSVATTPSFHRTDPGSMACTAVEV
jgi:hypothetical protein